jgi:hypothetical protein
VSNIQKFSFTKEKTLASFCLPACSVLPPFVCVKVSEAEKNNSTSNKKNNKFNQSSKHKFVSAAQQKSKQTQSRLLFGALCRAVVVGIVMSNSENGFLNVLISGGVCWE